VGVVPLISGHRPLFPGNKYRQRPEGVSLVPKKVGWGGRHPGMVGTAKSVRLKIVQRGGEVFPTPANQAEGGESLAQNWWSVRRNSDRNSEKNALPWVQIKTVLRQCCLILSFQTSKQPRGRRGSGTLKRKNNGTLNFLGSGTETCED